MKLKLLSILLLACFGLHLKAQRINGYKRFSYTDDCYSGDCQNGYGVISYYQFEEGDASPYRADSRYPINFYYFEGNFKDGKIVNGDAYVVYGYTKKLRYSKSEYLEEITLKTKVPEFAEVKKQQKPFYIGEFKHKRGDVQLHGKGKFFSYNSIYEGIFNNNAFVEGIIKPSIPRANTHPEKLEGSFSHIPKKIENYVERMRTKYPQGMLPYTSGLNESGLHLIAGKITYTNGDVFMGNAVGEFKKNGPGIYYNKAKGTSTIGIWQADELLKDVPDVAMDNAKVKDTATYILKINYADDPYFAQNPVAFIYKGQLQHKQPHGWGVMTNADADSAGITFYYAGFFKNGKKDGTGYQYKDEVYTSTLYQNGQLIYVTEYTILKRGTIIYTGTIKNGKYNGKGTLTKIKPGNSTDNDQAYRTVYEGTFVNGKFTGENLISGYSASNSSMYEQSGYFEDGKLINGEKRFGTISLKVGDVINYMGKKVAVSSREVQNSTITLGLSNGEKISYGLYYLFSDNGQAFKQTCAVCKGTGKGIARQKLMGAGTTTQSVSYTNATSISGGYYTITTNYHPVYETIPTKCETCNGTGVTYKKMELNAGSNNNYIGKINAAPAKKEKTAQEAYNEGLEGLKYGGGAMTFFSFQEAGNKGHAQGAYYAGYMIENGKGIKYSSTQETIGKAIEWYKKAAALGSEEAKKALIRLNVK